VSSCFALSTRAENVGIVHFIVAPTTHGGYSLENNPDTAEYESLDALVNNSPTVAPFLPVKMLLSQ